MGPAQATFVCPTGIPGRYLSVVLDIHPDALAAVNKVLIRFVVTVRSL